MGPPTPDVTVVVESPAAVWTLLMTVSMIFTAVATISIACLTRQLRRVAEKTAGLQESQLLLDTRPALTMRAVDPLSRGVPLYDQFSGVHVVNEGRGVAVLDLLIYDDHEVSLDEAELAPGTGIRYLLRDGIAKIIKGRHGGAKRLPQGKRDSISLVIAYHEPIRNRRFRHHFRLNIHDMTVVPLHCEDLGERPASQVCQAAPSR
ncbi:MAG TPA: hypothetical protein VM219_04890 [Phycisphaerae bacterium]|nr:hypothetical protein [Phycisphaerae bacterium]